MRIDISARDNKIVEARIRGVLSRLVQCATRQVNAEYREAGARGLKGARTLRIALELDRRARGHYDREEQPAQLWSLESSA